MRVPPVPGLSLLGAEGLAALSVFRLAEQNLGVLGQVVDPHGAVGRHSVRPPLADGGALGRVLARRQMMHGQEESEGRTRETQSETETFAHQGLLCVSMGILEINGMPDKCYIRHTRVSSRPISGSQFLPEEGVDQHYSGPIVQRDGQLRPRLGDVVGGLLSSEESVEEDEPGGETAQHQLMAFFSHSVETLSWLRLLTVLTWPRP